MVEKVSLLEAELRERDRQLASMQEEVNLASRSTTGAPDLDAARGGYLGFVEGLRGKLAEAMPDAKFDRTSVFPVEGPDPSKPIASKVAFRITSNTGRSGEMVIPLFAAPSGEWEQPKTADIVAGFKTKLAAPPVAVNTAAAPTPQLAAPKRAQPTDVMGANRTVEVHWDDESTPAGRNTAPQTAPQQQPVPQPDSPPMPKKVMPTSRDVIIDFE